MTEKILPLPVKKNKFGQRVADISVEKYYRQIFEEVLEAHECKNICDYNCDDDWLSGEEFVRQLKREAEELVDVITCCVTRFKIIYEYKDFDFDKYFSTYIEDAKKYYREPADFYTDLATAVMCSYHAADVAKMCDYMRNEGCGDCATHFDPHCLNTYSSEKHILSKIIVMCIKRLEYLGYDESERQELYAKVNDKNRKRGYFDD